jgi:hypothetical protein
VALAARVQRLESELQIERTRRIKVEQQLAGTRSALSRLKAVILRQRADDAERLAGPPSTH